MVGPSMGTAMFSTDLGRFAVRGPAVMPARIILRSVPENDMEAMVAELQAKYPTQCKAIKRPVTNLHDYFDDYDQQLHGAMFLHAILGEIYRRNLVRRRAVHDYAQDWAELNPRAFDHMLEYGMNAFTEDDVSEYGEDFLQEVLEELQLRKTQRDDANALAMERGHVLPLERTQQVSTQPLPATLLPQQHFVSSGQRISSAPNPSESALTGPQLLAYVSDSTPKMTQVSLARPPFAAPSPRAVYGFFEPPLRSAPLYQLDRHEFHGEIYDNGMNIPRSGFPDRIVAVPSPTMVGGPGPYHRASRTLHLPSKKSRNMPYFRGPVYSGPSNDARVLELQGVAKGRIPLEEGRMHELNSHQVCVPVPYPRHYPPPQQYDHSAPVVGPPPQGSRRAAIGPSNLSKAVVLPETDSSYAEANGKAGSAVTMQSDAMTEPNVTKANGSYGLDNLVPSQPFATPPRQREDNFRGPGTAKRHAQLDITPRHPVAKTSEAASGSSPAFRRFSNASNRPYDGLSSTGQSGQHQLNSGTRSRRWNEGNWPVSDRKVWIGHMRPDTDVQMLAGLLDRWRPRLDPISVSFKKGLKDERGFRGYTFAEYVTLLSLRSRTDLTVRRFDEPQQATEATTALNGQYIDSLQHRIFLNPAYIRPDLDENGGSPKKNQFRSSGYTGAQGPHGSSDQYQKRRVSNEDTRSGNQVMMSRPPSHLVQSLPKHDQGSTEWPPLRMEASQLDERRWLSHGIQSHEAQSNSQPGLHTVAPHYDDHKTDRDPDANKTQGGATPMRSSSTKVTAGSVNTSPSKTPSPRRKKKKGRNVNQDEPATEKTLKAKQRKEMLSNLRTEKCNAASASSSMKVASPLDGQQLQSPKDQKPGSDEQLTLAGEQQLWDSVGISTPDVGTESERIDVGHGDRSSEEMSCQLSSSGTGRRLSSESMIVSTDPTSHAQSEDSNEGADDIKGANLHEKDAPQSAEAQLILEGPAEVVEAENDVHTVTTAQQVPIEAMTASGAPPPINRDNDENTQGQRSHTNEAPSPSDRQTEATVGAQFDPERGSQPSGAISQNEDSVTTSEQVGDISDKISAEDTIPLDSNTAPSIQVPANESTTAPTTEQTVAKTPEKMSMPVQKRGAPRDPKLLVAVPKLLPPVRSSKSRGLHGQTSDPLRQTPATDGLNKPAESADMKLNSAIHEHQSHLSTPTVGASEVDGEQQPAPIIAQSAETQPRLPVDNDQISPSIATDEQTATEDLDGTYDHGSVTDSVATVEGDALVSVQLTPQSSPTAATHQANETADAQPSEQHPVVQQKKRKKKKPKNPKKPTGTQASTVDGNSRTHSRSHTADEDKAVATVPKAETPFLSDTNEPLAIPKFPLRNHSSMKFRNEALIDFIDGATEIATKAPDNTSTEGSNGQELSSAGSKLKMLMDLESDAGYSRLQSTQAMNHLLTDTVPPTSSRIEELDTEIPPEPSKRLPTPDPADRQARLEQLKTYLEYRNMVNITQILDQITPAQGQALDPVSESPKPDAPPSETTDDEQRDETSNTVVLRERIAQSYPSTRKTSPERGRRHSRSPIKGLGIVVPPTASFDSNKDSACTDTQPGKNLSYKQVASTPSTPTIQPGDIVEIIPREIDRDCKGGQGATIVRKKDPWRVPSSEQPWGAGEKGKGKASAETSEVQS
ncbi:MAG: hypothetical protein Q9181_006000 [Wetmoreana brouardii]